MKVVLCLILLIAFLLSGPWFWLSILFNIKNPKMTRQEAAWFFTTPLFIIFFCLGSFGLYQTYEKGQAFTKKRNEKSLYGFIVGLVMLLSAYTFLEWLIS